MTSVQVGSEGELLTITVDMAELARELARRLERSQQATDEAQQRWKESEWFLGEARATIAGLQAQLQAETEAHTELQAKYQDVLTRLEASELQREAAEQQRDEVSRVLDDVRRAYEEVLAMGTPAERRRAARSRRADVTVELQRPDGAVLFQGPLRDLSRTGMGFACDKSVDGAPELLWVTLHPDGQRPIEAIARLAWLRQEDGNGNYAGGCELLDVSPGSRDAFQEVLDHTG